MHARGPCATASPKLVASDEWQEPLRDGAQKHRRFIWAMQFGTGSPGSGGDKKNVFGALAENANAAIKVRNEVNRTRNLEPPRVIWPEPSKLPAEWWRNVS